MAVQKRRLCAFTDKAKPRGHPAKATPNRIQPSPTERIPAPNQFRHPGTEFRARIERVVGKSLPLRRWSNDLL